MRGLFKAIMEAMTFGPVVTTNVPGCEENIKKSRSELYTVKSVKSLENSIKNFANLPISNKKVMSKNAVNYSIKNFDENKIVKQYLDAIKLIDKNKIIIIGIGYVGLPLAVSLAKKGKVYGYDVSKKS